MKLHCSSILLAETNLTVDNFSHYFENGKKWWIPSEIYFSNLTMKFYKHVSKENIWREIQIRIPVQKTQLYIQNLLHTVLLKRIWYSQVRTECSMFTMLCTQQNCWYNMWCALCNGRSFITSNRLGTFPNQKRFSQSSISKLWSCLQRNKSV